MIQDKKNDYLLEENFLKNDMEITRKQSIKLGWTNKNQLKISKI